MHPRAPSAPQHRPSRSSARSASQQAGEVTQRAPGALPDAEVAAKLKLSALVIASVFPSNVMRITVQFSDPDHHPQPASTPTNAT